MGAFVKWLKSLIALKKPPLNNSHVEEKSKKKWRLWGSSLEGFGSSMKLGKKRGQVAASEASVSSCVLGDAFVSTMATVFRALPKDFMLVKGEEWAAIRIQTMFRSFLARRALKALKAVVRIQAIFRGQQVRKQAAVTLRCMQALVKIQARVRAHYVRISPEEEEQAVQKLLNEHQHQMNPLKEAEQRWCDRPGTVSEVKAKLHMRQKGSIKRERAIAYSISQQRVRSNGSPNSRKNQPSNSIKEHQRIDNNNNSVWSCLDRWMAAKPWESRLMEEEIHNVPLKMTPLSWKSEGHSCTSELKSVRVRKNHVTTRISSVPSGTSSYSAPSSETLYDESSVSTSPATASPTLISINNNIKSDKIDDFNLSKPNYMNLTQSTKAMPQRANMFASPNM